ncbi:MAG TPA: hypothetical protein QF624_00640 [Dehalococcoidia bacterium]|nr:hypothetical protein [Dehalococcoidia bacterium]
MLATNQAPLVENIGGVDDDDRALGGVESALLAAAVLLALASAGQFIRRRR